MPVSVHLGAADQAVGGLHGDGADQVVAQVLGDLQGQRLGQLPPGSTSTVQGVEQLGDGAARELDVHDRPGDADDAPDRRRFAVRWFSGALIQSSLPAAASASAPPTISLISWVIWAWRAWLHLTA